MKDLPDNVLVVLLIITISISVAGTVLTLGLMNDLQSRIELTGKATQGNVELIVLQLINMDVTIAEINFGSGEVSSATDLSTEQANPGTFSPCIEVGGIYTSPGECRGLQVENIGNVNINVTLNSTEDGNSFFLGDNLTDEFRFAIAEGNITRDYTDSCKTNGRTGLSIYPQDTSYLTGFMNWTNITKSFIYTVCHNLSFATDAKSIVVEVNLTVPGDEGSFSPGTERSSILSFVAESVD